MFCVWRPSYAYSCNLFLFFFTCLTFYRWTLESIGSLEPRQSVLEDDFEEEEEKEENEQLDGVEDGAQEKVHIFFLPKQRFCLIKEFGGGGNGRRDKCHLLLWSRIRRGRKINGRGWRISLIL